ncbi:MAG: RNA polymerase sigma factor [Chloroflexota bacterium]
MEPATREQAAPEEARDEAPSFAALYRRYVKRIYAYCYRRVGNAADAEDLTEQVFTEALEKFDAYEEQGRAGAWLFTIAHSRVVDFYRRERFHLPFEESMDRPSRSPSPEGQVLRQERRERLYAVLDRLNEKQRELILLRYGGDLTYAEIAATVGSSEAAVKMALYRLLDQLRGTWHLPQGDGSDE